MARRLKIEIVEGTTEGISYRGERRRRKTVLLRVGELSISKRALEVGLFLAICQLLDGMLTYLGLSLFGIEMEGNRILAFMMKTWGSFPVLFVSKIMALILVGFLTVYSHKRRWFRPIIVALALLYIVLAVLPWIYVLAAHSR